MITDDEIRSLCDLAIESGDDMMEEFCVMALDGEQWSRDICESTIKDARASAFMKYEAWKARGRL